ncbi:Putative UBA-like superfamily, heterokaryon incompatibility, Ubiquitin-associated [Septoria linicola]|uniref:UBA-like superfamily, heterokaryon incompatibility, Ubiquitin-associated n=1 Tax=Septoria linicola TaxID=215465 RepID=A0A9Q9AH13_9PEZI|nr:Putative UBA-like superfamily, heterokaryon incompatibility, Ubiquitin-associated [Septoria linicola]
MKGVISHYAMQQYAMRGAPPFRVPQHVKDIVRSLGGIAQDRVCQKCRSIFQIMLEAVNSNTELQTYPHHDNWVDLAISASKPNRSCPVCKLFLEVVMEDLPDPMPELYQKRGTNISFTEEKLNTLVSPVAKGVVRFSYSGPTDALSNRYFQVDLGMDWTTKLPSRALSKEVPLSLSKDWLSQCFSSHPNCPRIKDQEFPTRLVDVGLASDKLLARLVESGQNGQPGEGRYLALSHCWGSLRPTVVTNLQNLDQHLQQIPFELLSKNFRDAIIVTRELGYRYIWIDSLCIVQDSALDWEKECTRMEAVYANAAITIAAVGAASSSEGFLNTRPPQKACEVMLQHKDGDPVMLRISRMATGQSCVFHQDQAALDSRAWALQERLLSARILSFGAEQMYYECCTSEFFESVHFPIESSLSERESWLNNPAAMQERPSTLDFYLRVGEYSNRYLTKASDKLPAVGGIARRFQSLTRDQYVAGLWRSDILQGLLWRAGWHHGGDHSARHAYDLDALHDAPPSWSWASCEVPVQFQNVHKDQPLVDILRCEAQLVGTDVLGQVSGGELEVVGWTIECIADEKHYKPHWWGEDLRADVCGREDVLFARLFRDRPLTQTSPVAFQVTAERSDPPTTDYEAKVTSMEAMGFARSDIESALRAAHHNPDRAIEYLLNGLPESDEEDDPPPLPARPSLPARPQGERIVCLIMTRSFPVSYTPGWDWCGLALKQVREAGPYTFQRMGYVYASRSHSKYEKLEVYPEDSMEDIRKRSKRKICIV